MIDIRVPAELYGLDMCFLNENGQDSYGNKKWKLEFPSHFVNMTSVPCKSRNRWAYNVFNWEGRNSGKTRAYFYEPENECVESTIQIGPFKASFGDGDFLGHIEQKATSGNTWDHLDEFKGAEEFLQKSNGSLYSAMIILLHLIDTLKLWDETWKRD